MNRKEFLVQLTGYGALGAGLAASGFAPCCGAAQTLSAAQPKSEEGTPIDKQMAWAHKWVKRFFDNLDAEIDEPARKRLMHANGRTCYRGAVRLNKFKGTLDDFKAAVDKYSGGPDPAMRREGDTIFFNYVANPDGLKNADGWCLCPLVEKGPEGLSGTFCECSVGYVGEMFSEIAGRPVEVELLESLKRGGKRCRFKINLTANS